MSAALTAKPPSALQRRERAPWPERLRITITDRDVRQGECKNRWHCPLALALNRSTPDLAFGFEWWAVDGAGSAFVCYVGGKRKTPGSTERLATYTHSRRLRRAIAAFDCGIGAAILPGTYLLRRDAR